MLGPEDSSVGCTAHHPLSRPNGHQRPPTLQASASQAVLVGAGVGASQQGDRCSLSTPEKTYCESDC